ncbi:MAG: hypothetical protein KFW07_02205 [Mycoplasmataceae bacterium]|nr:hypothetical protein [Mycoplasmataceae bacterium]
MNQYEIQAVALTVNGYKIEDIILWTVGLFLSVISIIFSVLSYHFSNKSAKLMTELMEKTWVTSETDKFFFVNMKTIKHQNNNALILLNSKNEISYQDYVSHSLGTRIIHINKETIDFLLKTKYEEIINTYIVEKQICDDMFFEAVELSKITSASKEIIPYIEREKLKKYHNRIGKFVSHILSEYTKLTI